MQLKDIKERFWEKVDKNGPIIKPELGPCWIWKAGLNRGYGRYYITSTKHIPSHRFAYETLVGPIPKGLILDHLCRNTKCVNPSHLEPVTNRENVLRGDSIKSTQQLNKTHCPKGHPYDIFNTWIDKDVYRSCKICHNEREKARYKALHT